jgi:hypothetical protein
MVMVMMMMMMMMMVMMMMMMMVMMMMTQPPSCSLLQQAVHITGGLATQAGDDVCDSKEPALHIYT